MIKKKTVVRLARPTNNLEAISKMYKVGLGFKVLAEFKDHEGFDGVILGHKNNLYHLEFTHHYGTVVENAPTKDNLIIFYIENKNEWEHSCKNMIRAGFNKVKSYNPYWDNSGQTFEDPEGYRVVLQNTNWDL